jgi:hypothetical protein
MVSQRRLHPGARPGDATRSASRLVFTNTASSCGR